jgi:hypothetical protein
MTAAAWFAAGYILGGITALVVLAVLIGGDE